MRRIWGVLQEKQPAPDFNGILPSVSYAPFERGHTVADDAADSEKIRADLKKLSTLTRAVRLYSSTEGAELVPPIAAEFGLKVTVGAWIDTNADRNDREIKAAIKLARKNSNVIGIVVGNETIYRGEQIPIENLWVLPATKEPIRPRRSGFAANSANRWIRPRWNGSPAMNRSGSGMPAPSRRTSAPKR